MEKIKKILFSNKFLVPFILLFMFFVMITSSIKDSAIRDEMPHIVAGYAYVTTGDYRLNPEHPPLIKTASGLMLLLINPQPKLPDNHFERPMNNQWSEGEEFLYKEGNDADLMLFLGRLPIIFLSILLGFFVYKWAKKIYGKKAGLFALTLYAFDANIIAHSRFITTDLGAMATIFINLYFLWLFLEEPTKKRLLWIAISLAVALLTKFSAPILVITYALVGIYLTLRPQKYEKGNLLFTRFFNAGIFRRFLGYLLSFFSAALIALIIVWIVYLVQTINMPADIYPKSIEAGLDDGPIKNFLLWLSQIPILRSLGHYFLGFFMVSQHAIGGHSAFLLGEISNGWWYYYLIAFLVKTPLPIMAFILSIFIFWKSEKHKNHKAKAILLFPILVLCGLALSTRINLGIRYLLPIFPLLYVFMSFLAERVSLLDIKEVFRKNINFKTITSLIFFLLLSWHIISSVKVYPHYLSYYNEAIGGPKNGMRYVTDSNIDWGQDLKRLAKYVEESNIDKIRLDYFGGGMPEYYLGDKYIFWNENKAPEPGWYAISVTYFQQSQAQNRYHWLKGVKPYTTIGHSILIFKYKI